MRKSFFGLAALGVAGVIAIACGGDDTAVPDGGTGADAAPTGTNTDSGNTTTPPDDAGAGDDAGELVTDGGANLDPNDGGDNDDAGPCNNVVNDATKIQSKCSSRIPDFAGGPLVAGTYHLQNVDALGSMPFCANQFVSTGIAETLVLTVDTAGVGTAQTVTVIGNRPAKSTTLTLDPPDGGAVLQLTAVCPPKNGGKVAYTSELKGAKQLLTLRLGYGQGAEALYHYEKQ